jgi:hypothetical protein
MSMLSVTAKQSNDDTTALTVVGQTMVLLAWRMDDICIYAEGAAINNSSCLILEDIFPR